MRAVIYARISRAPDASADTSTPRQIRNCRAFLAAKGWQECAVRRDVDRSAYRQGVVRDGFDALMDDIVGGEVDVVVVWRLDRLTRRPSDFERVWTLCERHGVALASVTEPIDTSTPIGVAIVRLLLTFAGLESTVRGERLSAKFKEQAMQGMATRGGRRPYGHSRDLSTVVEEEAVLLREAARRVIDGERVASIVGDFHQRGIIGGHGGPWSPAGLRSTLTSARMAGDRSYRGDVVVQDCFAPILERRTYELVKSILRSTPQRMRPRASLLQGLLVCGCCGRTLIQGRSSKTNSPMYKCPRPPTGCSRISVMAHCVEPTLVSATRQRLCIPTPLPDVNVSDSTAVALRDLNRVFFLEHGISRREWYLAREDIVGASQQRAAWWRLHPDIPPGTTGPELNRRWDSLSSSAQHALISAVVRRVAVRPQPPRTGGFRPERLHIELWDDDTRPTSPGKRDPLLGRNDVYVPGQFPQLDDPAWLRRQYVERGRAVNEIAQSLGCSRSVVKTALATHGISTPTQLRCQVPVDWLHEQYVVQGLSLADIGAQVGVSWVAIRDALAEAGIPLRQQAHRTRERSLTELSPVPKHAELADIDWLRERLEDGSSLNAIANEVGCHWNTVRRALDRHGLTLR